MPRPRRLNLPGIPQHITQRGNNRQPCFYDNSDRKRYLTLLGKSAVQRDCEVHAYVLMGNHVHLLVTPNAPDGASLLMQDLGREYVRYFNARHRRCGTLWQGRFKSSLVDSETYCLACYRYIELNPVRAALVAMPDQYRWSSFAANALEQSDDVITPHSLWLALGRDTMTRCHTYREFVRATSSQSTLEKIRYANRKGLPLGSDRFRAMIEAELGIRLRSGKVGRPAKKE